MLTAMRSQSARQLVLNITAACYYRAEARLSAQHWQSIYEYKLLYHGFVLHSDDNTKLIGLAYHFFRTGLLTVQFEQG